MKSPSALIVLSAIAWLLACGSPTTTPAATSTLAPAPAAATATGLPTPTSAPSATAVPTVTPSPTPSPTPEAPPTATPQVAALFEYYRAVRLLEIQEFDRSIAAYGLVIRKLPSFARAYQGRGLAFFGDERFELAMEDFDTAIELEPDFAGAYVDRARLHIELGNTDEAVKDLELAILRFDRVRESAQLDAARALLDSIRR